VDSPSLAISCCLTTQGIKCLKEGLCHDMEEIKGILSRSVDNRNILMFQCSNSYLSRASMAHHQVVDSCIKSHVQPFYPTLHAEVSQVRHCMFRKMDMCTVIKGGLVKSKHVC
jgi:hypothetical protein